MMLNTLFRGWKPVYIQTKLKLAETVKNPPEYGDQIGLFWTFIANIIMASYSGTTVENSSQASGLPG